MSTAGTASSAASWTDLNRLAATPSTELFPGSILKGRFVLESIVPGGDSGGMGVIYKARDLIKEEALDRNPYVAIKVLNEEFKRHPDSMKALQREARKAQTLSHPNIINVSDFDRDGGTVFMQMELLEGSALDEVIRAHRQRGGMPVREALPVIQALGRALGHAHANGIVHSDFKPSNAYVTGEGIVKVLDFGIARAAKIGGAAASSEKTNFDAGTLGALTLPYASCEQIEGQDPDPSDDVYALAVVSYELLTGRHPFERANPEKGGHLSRMDAVSARDAKLTAAPVRGLSRTQWRTLQSGLSFDRRARPRNATEFITGLEPKKLPVAVLASAAAVVVLLIVVAAVTVPSYVHQLQQRHLSERLRSTDAATVTAALATLGRYSAADRRSLLDDEAVKGNLLTYFRQRSRQAFDVAAGRYDYAGALAPMKEAQSLYPDSERIAQDIEALDSAREAEVPKQAERFEALMNQGVLIPSQGRDNALGVRDVIAKLDPKYPLLNDRRLPTAFAAQTRTALDAGNGVLAGELLAAGLQLAPQDVNLNDLKDAVERRRSNTALASQVGQLESRVVALGAPGATLQNFRDQRDPMIQLLRAAPASKSLLAAQRQLTSLVGAVVAAGVRQHQVAAGQSLLVEFSDLLPESFLDAQRADIVQAVGEPEARVAQAAQLRTALARLTQSPRSDDAWVSDAQRTLRNLEDLVGGNDAAVRDAHTAIAQAFLAQAQGLLAQQRLTEAQRVLDLARSFGLSAAQYEPQAAALAQARSALESENRDREAAARIAAVKQRVIDQAKADHLDNAQQLLADLQKQLPAADAFLSTDGPRAVGNAYLARARKYGALAHFEDAAQAAAAAARSAPREPGFQSAAQAWQSAFDIAGKFSSEPDFSALKGPMEKLRAGDGADSAAMMTGLEQRVIERLNRVAQRDPSMAMRLRDSAAPLFPKGDFANYKLPAMASTPVPSSTAPSAVPIIPVPTPVPTSAPTHLPTPVPTPVAHASSDGGAAVPDSAARPCTAALAGLGKNLTAGCRDALASGGVGPELVVIPGQPGLALFSIMRNETTIGEYAGYCRASGCAAADGAPNLPISGIAVADAEKYAAWLSKSTGAKYRLPSEDEWGLAAGTEPDPAANCAGSSLRPANVGAVNAFGLRHVAGNVQEWVKATWGGWRAFGGAIGDPSDLCSPLLSRPHSGTPDGRTGFRLVREIH